MPERMSCLQVHDWDGELQLTETTVPTPKEDEVLIEVDATSVGLTVNNAIHGQLGGDQNDLPRIPGHEIVGRVVECGSGVTSFEEDDLVGAYFYLTCGHCDACLSARGPLCTNHSGFVGVDIDGGYAEFVALPSANVIRFPRDLDPIEATAIPDAIATPYHIANQRAKIQAGDDVMVLGAGGGVGIHLVQMAQYFGGRVTAVDQDAEKLQKCSQLGAEQTINTQTQSVLDAGEDSDMTYDVIVDFTGVMDLVDDAVTTLSPRGRFVHLTAFPGQTMDVAPRSLVRGEHEILGSRYCSKFELQRSAKLVSSGVIDPIVTEVVDFKAVPSLLAQIESGEVTGRGAVVP